MRWLSTVDKLVITLVVGGGHSGVKVVGWNSGGRSSGQQPPW
ncbi:hypothetical protein A2U01_0031289 [Trifolium medium]|uniref:Uncharacterized protein n=1 Tax=Trifolium medium TaxID=97028 RepID=A0A392PEX9_9FABA|nr:hypothetical protein [Trifolium medium]